MSIQWQEIRAPLGGGRGSQGGRWHSPHSDPLAGSGCAEGRARPLPLAGRERAHHFTRNDSPLTYSPSRAQAARSSTAPRTSAGSSRLSGRRAGARTGGRAGRPRGRETKRICTLSPKRSRSTVRRSPSPSTRPSSRASAPTQNAPEKSSPFSALSRAPRRLLHQVDEDLVDAGLKPLQALDVLRVLRAGRGRAWPCSRRRCGRAARCRSARSGGRSRNSPKRRRSNQRLRTGRRKSRRPRRRSCSRRKPPRPRRRRGPAASSPRRARGCAERSGAIARPIRRASSPPPRRPCAPGTENARSSIGATAAIDSPARNGITAPIAPLRRTHRDDGILGAEPARQEHLKLSRTSSRKRVMPLM